MRYKDHKLGKTVQEILAKFDNHPGIADKKPFGFDIHQGFEFFRHLDGKLYRKAPGVMIELTELQERELIENIGMGAVEFYLKRPTSGLPPFPVVEKTLLHGATGEAIPMS